VCVTGREEAEGKKKKKRKEKKSLNPKSHHNKLAAE